MRTNINRIIERIISSEPDSLSSNKSMIDSLVKLLCDVAGIDIHPSFFIDEGASITSQGKAVSMTTAAQCAEEYMRTQVFMRGVHQAIQDQLSEKGAIQILYAGTGPFGLLLIPLLPLFDPDTIKITLLDIHAESISKLNKLITLLDTRSYIEKIECIDILEWEAESSQKFDLIISETMKAMLVQEPQVSIFAHLSPYLADGGSLIPQKVIIEGWLQTLGVDRQMLGLGEVFTLDYQSSLALSRMAIPTIETVLSIPAYTDRQADLKFTTTLQVYGDHWLHEKQCSLNLPYFIEGACPDPEGQLHCQYQFGEHPRFKFDFKNRLKPSEEMLVSIDDRSLLNLPYLNRVWQKSQKDREGKLAAEIKAFEWPLDMHIFDILGLGLEPAMQALYTGHTPQPFIDLILLRNKGHISIEQQDMIERCISQHFQPNQPDLVEQDAASGILSQSQLQFWEQNGYLVIPNVLDRLECQQLRDEVCNFIGVSLDAPETWYSPTESLQHIMVQLFNSPTQEKIRSKDKIKQIFAQLWQTDQLIPSTDRASFNPPETEHWKFPGPHMHWDIKAFETPLPFATQGLIYLTDTADNQGAFCCVPGFHHKFDQWLKSLPLGADPQNQNWTNFDVKSIAANAGDLIVWHHALPHGSSPNSAQSPRVVQYFNMRPAS